MCETPSEIARALLLFNAKAQSIQRRKERASSAILCAFAPFAFFALNGEDAELQLPADVR